jgi:phenylacetic acid degradation operon negative regulatory protein
MNGQPPRSLIVTVYGLYAREVGSWLSIASLIKLLAECGVDAPAVRSAISRLKKRGLLVPARIDGVAGYALSEEAHRILREGDRRIFERRRASLGDGWVLAVFSVPESERDRRHQLRSRLSWLGFGAVGSGVWIAPAHLLDSTRDALAHSGLDGYVNLFRADHLGPGDIACQIQGWWDLDRLRGLYDEFLRTHAPVLSRYRATPGAGPAGAFADLVSALTDWRRLPYSDPGLPPEALPPDWAAARAADTFFELYDRLATPARHFAESILRPADQRGALWRIAPSSVRRGWPHAHRATARTGSSWVVFRE